MNSVGHTRSRCLAELHVATIKLWQQGIILSYRTLPITKWRKFISPQMLANTTTTTTTCTISQVKPINPYTKDIHIETCLSYTSVPLIHSIVHIRTILCGINNILHNNPHIPVWMWGILCKILLVPQNIIMDMDLYNVMLIQRKNLATTICSPKVTPFFHSSIDTGINFHNLLIRGHSRWIGNKNVRSRSSKFCVCVDCCGCDERYAGTYATIILSLFSFWYPGRLDYRSQSIQNPHL